MGIFEALAVQFFRVFGITQPSAEKTRRAAWFLMALLVGTVVLVTVVGIGFFVAMHRA